MSSKFTISGTDTKVTFEYTAATMLISNVISGAAEYLWEHGYGDHGTEEAPKLFKDLTNVQKLSLVEENIKKVILDMANTNKSVKAQDVARATEEANDYRLRN